MISIVGAVLVCVLCRFKQRHIIIISAKLSLQSTNLFRVGNKCDLDTFSTQATISQN